MDDHIYCKGFHSPLPLFVLRMRHWKIKKCPQRKASAENEENQNTKIIPEVPPEWLSYPCLVNAACSFRAVLSETRWVTALTKEAELVWEGHPWRHKCSIIASTFLRLPLLSATLQKGRAEPLEKMAQCTFAASCVQRCTACGCLEASCPGEKPVI